MSDVAGLIALLSAVAFAGSTSLQHEAAGKAPSPIQGTAKLLGHLLGQPVWLAGQVLAVLGLVLHAVALFYGSIAAVQPIVISGVVLAVPIRSALSRHWPRLRELAAVAAVAVGLTVFLVTSSPSGGTAVPQRGAALLICALGAVVAGSAMLSSRWVTDRRHGAFLLGAASGVLFGVVAGLLKSVVHAAGHGGMEVVLTSWTAWALIVFGGSAVATNQQAYRFARLSASMPVLNVVNGLVSLGFGVIAFHERLRHGPLFVFVEILSFLAISFGLLIVARFDDCEPPPP